jgi:hypothetical protein
MTRQSIIARQDALEQAILTVIKDARIPKTLRTALEVYGRQWAEPNNHGISVVPPKSTNPFNTFRRADDCRLDNSGSNEGDNIENGAFTDLARKIDIHMWMNVESLDWSLEINGHRWEHATLEDVESLIECSVVATVLSVMKTFSARPQ